MREVKYPFLNKNFEKGKFKIKKGEKPYLKQDGKVSKFKIWIVDGEYIRKNICEDFVNMGQHYLYKFIQKKELIKKTHIKLLQELKNGICVWLINGEIVRDFFYSSFAGGGHDKVYNFIPKKEIWIDNDILKRLIH